MKLMTMKQYMNMSNSALIRKINKVLRVMPKAKLARLCYNITKSKLPRLSIKKRKELKRIYTPSVLGVPYSLRPTSLRPTKFTRTRSGGLRKTKRKFSRKQLAAQRLFAKRARAGTLRKPRRQKHISRKELMASRKRWLG